MQQIAAQSANALFELLVLPAKLKEKESGLEPYIVSFLQRTDTPVLVAAGEPKSIISRILICTRAGEPSKSDVRFGGRLARYLGARVTLLYVTQASTEAPLFVRRHLQQGSATLRALEVPNEIVVRADPDPAAAIIREAAEHDLLVIGGHRPRRRSVFARGDITVQVLAAAKCPVLVVPPET
jgi:nucleotide-binding universal stress UspA family protein